MSDRPLQEAYVRNDKVHVKRRLTTHSERSFKITLPLWLIQHAGLANGYDYNIVHDRVKVWSAPRKDNVFKIGESRASTQLRMSSKQLEEMGVSTGEDVVFVAQPEDRFHLIRPPEPHETGAFGLVDRERVSNLF